MRGSFDEGEEKTVTVRLRGVTVAKKKEDGTTNKQQEQQERNEEDSEYDDEDLFDPNKENVIEDDRLMKCTKATKDYRARRGVSVVKTLESREIGEVRSRYETKERAKELEREGKEDVSSPTMASLRLLNFKSTSSKSTEVAMTASKPTIIEASPTSSSVTSDGFESARDFATQQEAEFVSWLNRTISPRDTTDEIESTSSSAMKIKSEQLRARELRDARNASRRVLTHLYSQDAEVGVIMREVEYRNTSKLIRLKSDGGISFANFA